MRSRRLYIPAAFLLLASCDGGTTEPTQPPTLTLTADEIELRVGEEETLTATYVDPEGGPTPTITWRTTNAAVASVTGTGTVRGVGVGEAQVIASAGGVADTAVVTVTPPIAVECGSTGLSFAVGEVRTMTPAEAAAICLSGANGSEFTVVVTDTGAAAALVTAAATGTITGSGPPNPNRIPGFAALGSEPGLRRRNLAFDIRLRELGQRLIRQHGATARREEPRGDRIPAALRAVTQVGDTLTVKVDTANNCSAPVQEHGARVVAIGAHSIILEDRGNPAGGLTAAQYQQVASTFDNQIWASDTENFGEPADIDENGKVFLFYTRAVNQLTPDDPEGKSFVGGYFFPGDIFPVSQCATSNSAEIFYLLAPDPNGSINNNPVDPDDVIEQTEGTVAHEFEHLINAERRLYVNHADDFETTYLDEGLAHIAEELLFYRVSGLTPRQNIDLDRLRSTPGALEAANNFQISNFGRFDAYLKKTESNGPFEPDDDDLETRGAIWAFLRYGADRKNGNDRDLWFGLVNSTTNGKANLSAVLTADLGEWLGDFTTATYTDEAVPGVDVRYTQPSWDFRELVSAIQPQDQPQVYSLDTRTLAHGTTLSLALSDNGGSAYLRAGVAAGGVGSIKVTENGGAVPPRVRVTVVRTR